MALIGCDARRRVRVSFPFEALAAVCLAAFAASGCLSSGDLGERESKAKTKAAAPVVKIEVPEGADYEEPEPEEEPVFRVKGEPSGAEVYIDGVYQGTAPVETVLKRGFHEVRVSLEGYRPWKDSAFYDGNSEMTVRYELEPIIGYLRASVSPADASMMIDGPGGSIELEPGINEIPVGKRVVTARRFGYASASARVEILEDEEIAVELELQPKDMEIEVDASPRSFNPVEPGALGRTVLTASPDGYGYVRVSVNGPGGTTVAVKEFPFASDYGELRFEWRGRDAAGRRVPPGDYEAVFEPWPLPEPLPGGAFPDGPPERARRLALAITNELRSYASLMSGVSGLAYSPDAEVLKGAIQAGGSFAGTYLSPEVWFGFLAGQLRVAGFASALPWELSASVGLESFPAAPVDLMLGLGFKMALADSGAGFVRFKNALSVKARLFPLGLVSDPFGDMIGASTALPLQLGLGPVDLVLCPEILLSPYRPGDIASATEDPYALEWFFVPYARAGIRARFGAASAGISGFLRFRALGDGEPGIDLPFGLAAEAVMADPAGTRYSVVAMAQIEDGGNWYFILGCSVGGLWPLGD